VPNIWRESVVLVYRYSLLGSAKKVWLETCEPFFCECRRSRDAIMRGPRHAHYCEPRVRNYMTLKRATSCVPSRLIFIACAFGRRRHGAMFTAGPSRALSIIFSHVFAGPKNVFLATF